jgi:hypothetical protein
MKLLKNIVQGEDPQLRLKVGYYGDRQSPSDPYPCYYFTAKRPVHWWIFNIRRRVTILTINDPEYPELYNSKNVAYLLISDAAAEELAKKVIAALKDFFEKGGHEVVFVRERNLDDEYIEPG